MLVNDYRVLEEADARGYALLFTEEVASCIRRSYTYERSLTSVGSKRERTVAR